MFSPQSEISEVQWMYKNSSNLTNREDYLLGRKIDKNLEQIESGKSTDGSQLYETKLPKNHVEHECIPFSIRAYRGIQSTEQVDMQRKVMEDPLTVIKQRELESRRKILENPVKLKELRGLLRFENEITRDDESRSKTKSTTNIDKERKDLSCEIDNGKLDKLLVKQYKAIRKILGRYEAKKRMNVRKLVETSKKKLSKEFRKIIKRSRRLKRSYNDSSSKYNWRKTTGPSHNKEYKKKEEKRIKTKELLNKQDMRQNGRRMDSAMDDTRYRKERFPERASSSSIKTKEINETKKHRSSEEKEAYRKIMMENAIWNDEKCAENVERYRSERRKEEELYYNSEFNKDFISRELLSSLSNKGSVESRIKSNLNNIQRCPGSMESKFL